MINRLKDKFRLVNLGSNVQGAGRDDVIPLRGHRADRPRFAYPYSADSIGVWFMCGRPSQHIAAVRRRFPGVEIQQDGEGEITYRYRPDGIRDARRLIRHLGGYKVVELSPEERVRRVESGKRLASAQKSRSGQSRMWPNASESILRGAPDT